MFNCHRYTKVRASYGNQFPSLAWEFNVDNQREELAFRVARCSEKDNFSREIAQAVLKRKPWFATHYNKELPLVVNAIECLESLIEGGDSFFNSPEERQFYDRAVNDYCMIMVMNMRLAGVHLIDIEDRL